MSDEAYKTSNYQSQRKNFLGIIPKSALLSAVARNAWTINFALASSAIAAIISGVVTVPMWGTAALIGGAVLAAGVNFYATYLDEKMSKTVDLTYRESRQIADAKVNAKEMAAAFKDALHEEFNAQHTSKVDRSSPAQVAARNTSADWKERVQLPEESVSQSIN